MNLSTPRRGQSRVTCTRALRARTLCTLLVSGLCGGLSACERRPVDAETPELAAPRKAALPAPAPESLLDAQGRLLPSGRHLEWLELPRGFQQTPRSRPRHHEFEARGVTVEQTRAYLAERMLTGTVDPLGEGFIYRAVMPLSGGSDAARFDIHVTPREQGKVVVLGIDSVGYPGAEVLPLSEMRRLLDEERARAE